VPVSHTGVDLELGHIAPNACKRHPYGQQRKNERVNVKKEQEMLRVEVSRPRVHHHVAKSDQWDEDKHRIGHGVDRRLQQIDAMVAYAFSQMCVR